MAAITPIIYTWEAQNTAGDTKRKVTSAIVLIGMCTGNVGTPGLHWLSQELIISIHIAANIPQVIGPQLFSTSQAPEYRPGLIACLIMFVTVAVFAV